MLKMLKVKECMKVTMEYTVRTTSRDGGTNESPPCECSFVYGVQVQYPSVEAAIMNKMVGDRVQVYVPPEELYGTYDDSLVRELPRSDYKQNRLAPGRMYREMKNKSLVQFMVKDLTDQVVVADFNDPKAGASAELDILIKDIREATKSEMRPSCGG
jgi:FKBP-type peptidyl-prolyl cis-trans isomerase SlyD